MKLDKSSLIKTMMILVMVLLTTACQSGYHGAWLLHKPAYLSVVIAKTVFTLILP